MKLENLYCKSLKSNSKQFRDNYDKIFRKSNTTATNIKNKNSQVNKE